MSRSSQTPDATRADRARPRIHVAGIGSAGPTIEDPRSIPEMVLEAVEHAIDDAGVNMRAVDAVVTASVDLFDGLTASSIAVTEVVGAVMKPETRMAGDALCAVTHAACQLWGGVYGTVLVVAHGKPSMADHDALTAWAMDPIHLQPLGVSFRVCAGLVAQRLSEEDPGAPNRWAGLAAAHRSAAGEACSRQDVRDSPMVASPITRAMCAPLADAAYAVVLRRTDREDDARGAALRSGEPRRRRGDRRVYLSGVGHDLAPHSLGERDPTQWEGLRRACARAYAHAGVDSAAAFDLLEPSCAYAHEQDQFVAAVEPRPDALLSPDGGLFGGTAPITAGLSRLVAATRRMRAQPALKRALAHGTWGPAGQGQAVAVLEASS